jgi:hypothetical protein
MDIRKAFKTTLLVTATVVIILSMSVARAFGMKLFNVRVIGQALALTLLSCLAVASGFSLLKESSECDDRTWVEDYMCMSQDLHIAILSVSVACIAALFFFMLRVPHSIDNMGGGWVTPQPWNRTSPMKDGVIGSIDENITRTDTERFTRDVSERLNRFGYPDASTHTSPHYTASILTPAGTRRIPIKHY